MARRKGRKELGLDTGQVSTVFNISGIGVPSLYRRVASWRCCSSNFLGLPPVLPLALAAANPALVRSRMMLRSNSAKAPKTWKIKFPPEVEVSMDSWILRKPTFLSFSSSTNSSRFRSDRPRRSNRQTARTSPSRRESIACCSPGWAALAPLTSSTKIFSQPLPSNGLGR